MQWLQTFDLEILIWIQDHLSCAFFDKLMPAVSFLGNGGLIWILFGIFLLFKKETRSFGISFLLALSFTAIVTNLFLKPWIARPRPFTVYPFSLLLSPPTDFSFPSGHTSAASSAAYMTYTYKKQWGIIFGITTCLMAFSRLYLCVHYPSDILAGALVGMICSAIVSRIIEKKGHLFINIKH